MEGFSFFCKSLRAVLWEEKRLRDPGPPMFFLLMNVGAFVE